MSAKCEYSARFKPLIIAKRAEFNNDESALFKWAQKYFKDPVLAISRSNAGSSYLSEFKVTGKKLEGQTENVDSIRTYYSSNATGYNQCIRAFNKRVVESSVYNYDTNEFVDAEAVSRDEFDGYSKLNWNLFKYKIDLIAQMYGETEGDIREYYEDGTTHISVEKLNRAINTAILRFEQKIAINDYGDDKGLRYQAYVILKNFNKLISERTPFIKIKKEFEDTTTHGVDMYTYVGPNVKHRVSFTTNEHISAESQYSDLSKILLNYLPEFQKSPVLEKVIGTDGFTSVMTHFKAALIYGNDSRLQKYTAAYYEGKLNEVDNDTGETYMLGALKAYERILYSKSTNSTTKTALVGKLGGIIHYIYESKLPTDIKEMFTSMFIKTIPLRYRTYSTDGTKIKKINLNDSFVQSQILDIQEIIDGQVLLHQMNPGNWARAKAGKITVSGNINKNGKIVITNGKSTWTIKSDPISQTKYKGIDFKSEFKGTTCDMFDFIQDLLGTMLPLDTYQVIAHIYAGDDYQEFDDPTIVADNFAPIVAAIIFGSEKDGGGVVLKKTKTVDFRKSNLSSHIQTVAAALSTAYGQDTRNVVEDVNGNKLPTNGLTSLAFNMPKHVADVSSDKWNAVGNLNPLHDSFLAINAELGKYNAPIFGEPIIRQGVRINNSVKKVSDLTLSELLELAITYDFMDDLDLENAENTSYEIGLQNANFADKERQFIIPFAVRDITVGKNVYEMGDLIKKTAIGFSPALSQLEKAWREIRWRRYEILQQNFVNDYNEALGKDFKTLSEVDEWLKANPITISELRKKFRAVGREFVEVSTAEEVGGIARVNSTLLDYVETFSSEAKSKARLNRSRAYFAKDIWKSHLRLSRHTNSVIDEHWKSIPDTWKEKRANNFTGNLILFKVFDKDNNEVVITDLNSDLITNPDYTVELNPILNAYMMSDIIYSNEYNAFATGDCIGHPSKGGTNAEEIEASRLIAANKRNVIYGASIHAFSHNLANNRGVNKRIKISVVKDIKAKVWNMIGGFDDKNSVDDELKSMDGAGIQSIYEAIFEQESLKDAAVGVDEKTILGWQDKYHGTQILLKWAVFALTNERRRISRGSSVNGEAIFKKMHSAKFSTILNMQTIWNNHVSKDPSTKDKDPNAIYFKDFETGKHYKIIDVETKGNKQARLVTEVNDLGEVINPNSVFYLDKHNKFYNSIDEISITNLTYNTLYDLDQFFGGCDEESLVNNKLQYSDKGNHIVADIICEKHLKDNFISYIVNESAIKVGATNINESDVLSDNNSELDTMEMSTENGGLQMNVEHELEDSEVSEMTQMISALIEKGFSYEIVKRIYEDIGGVVLESLSSIKQAIKNVNLDPSKLRIIFGKALIEAYAKGDRETLGLAQSFLVKAEKYLRENDIKNFKFPFSGATIGPSFIATVSSMLTKKGIRRKYAGVPGILTPSYNMIQVYGDGKLMDQYADEIRQYKSEHPEWSNVSIRSLMNDVLFRFPDGTIVKNPFLVYDKDKEFGFEDTIAIENLDGSFEKDVINSYEKFDKYKHDTRKIYILKSAPRNLKGSDTKFTLYERKRSIYESSIVRAANYSIKKTLTTGELELICDVLKDGYNVYNDDIVWVSKEINRNSILLDAIARKDIDRIKSTINLRRTLYNMVQTQMHNLQDKHAFRDIILTGGATITVTDVDVSGAEVVMGKQWARQFHLRVGDNIADILKQGSQFFRDRIDNFYKLPEVDTAAYSGVAYTKSGKPILVAISNNYEKQFTVSRNVNITTVDGRAYMNGKFLCDSKNKNFYQIQGTNNQLYDVVVVNSIEDYLDFITSEEITLHRLNTNPSENNRALTMQLMEEFLPEEKYEELLSKPGEEILVDLNTIEEDRLSRLFQDKAEKMLESFKLSLNMVGSRIPAQAMQSFQALKIVAFTDSETNDIYVNRHQTYLEGSDYDIDKSFMMSYEVGEDGLIESGSRLSKFIGVERAFYLNLPTGKLFTLKKDGAIISENDVVEIVRGNVDVINRILSGSRDIRFAEPVTKRDKNSINRYERLKKRALFMLNLHEKSYVSDTAIRNRVIHGILRVAKDPKNQLNFTSPISTDTQQAAADNSELGKDERHISMDIPSSKFMMQEQNMVGKACIGITAVALKCYFAKSYYYNSVLNDQIPALLSQGKYQDAVDTLTSLVFNNPITGRITTLANVNLRDLISFVEKTGLQTLEGVAVTSKLNKWYKDNKFNLLDCLKELKTQSNRVDCAMELSGLLSSATDNAKLLILSKINATTKFIDIYTVALQMGCTFEEIASIMTHPIFNALSKLVGNNILKPHRKNYHSEQAIEFYIGDDSLALVDFKGNRLKLLQQIMKSTDKAELNILLKDNIKIDQALDIAYQKLNNTNAVAGGDEFLEERYDEDQRQVTKNDWLAVIEFLEECVTRNNVHEQLRRSRTLDGSNALDDGIKKLKIVKNSFLDAAEEQTILGQLLGVNQGLKTSGFKQFNLCYNTEVFINKRLGLSGENSFSLLRFLRDDEYAEKMINDYESKKASTNILRVIKGVPHFEEMLNAMSDNDVILTSLSSKYDIAKKLAYKISGGNKYGINEKEYKQIEYYINDSFIVSFLTSKGLSFLVSKETPFYDHKDVAKPLTQTKSRTISDLYDLASFKLWMETEIIPKLKSDPLYRDHIFIQSLMYSVNIDRRTKTPRSFYRLPMNMLLIDRYTDSKERYQQILSDFNNISRNTIDGTSLTIGDAFFIYNAIVNKEGFGRNSMTRLFEDLVNSKEGTNLATEFYDFITEIDTNTEARNKFAESLLSENGEKDARTYIATNVPGSYVNGTKFVYGPDFTFFMSSKLRFFEANSPDVKEYISNDKTTTVSKADIRAAIIDWVRKMCGEDHVQVHKFGDQERGTNAYIKNGVIHINSDTADIPQVIHEYAHMIFAIMKFSPEYQNLYYNMISLVKKHPSYEDRAKKYIKRNISGSDLREEVFCDIFEDYLRNRVESWIGIDILNNNEDNVVSIIEKMLKMNVPATNLSTMDLGSSNITDVVKIFGSELFDFRPGKEMIDAIKKRANLQVVRTAMLSFVEKDGTHWIDEICD